MLVSTQRELLKHTGLNTNLFLKEDFKGNKALKKVLNNRNTGHVNQPVWILSKKASTLKQPFFSKRRVGKTRLFWKPVMRR